MTAALDRAGRHRVGTSSRSSRLIHGGLRYLEQLHIPLVRESLAERRRLLRNAPHLVSLQPQLFPIYGLPFVHKAFYDAGLTLYDVLGARHDGGWHRRLDAAETLEIAPSLRTTGLRGGLLYHDGMEDDARFTLAVLRTALASHPATVAVTRVAGDGRRHRPATGRSVRSASATAFADVDLEIRTRAVVDATGVWAADPDHPFASPSMRILPSRGAHLVVPRERIPISAGLTIRVPGRVVFLIPWPDHWLIGTTDAPYDGSPDRPSAERRRGRPAAGAPSTGRSTSTCGGTTWSARSPACGRSSRHRAGRRSRPRASIASRSSRTASCGSPAASTRPTGSWRATSSTPCSGAKPPARGRAQTAELPLIGAHRPIGPRPDRDRARGDPGSRRRAPRGRRPPRRPPRHGGAGRRRARSRARPPPAACPRPAVPRGRGRVGRPQRAGAFGRRRPVPPPPAQPGAGEGRAAVAPRVAAIMARELGWDQARCERERDAYLASAAREYGVAPPA